MFCGASSEHCIDDVSFIRQMINYEMNRNSNIIDLGRIYASGHSNGCAMAQVCFQSSSVY